MTSQRDPKEQERQSTSPPIAESTWTSRLFIVTVCVLFRWWNAYLTRTYDNPDEYWQAPEVAHRLVFGYGYLTWEWTYHIRSFFHPLVFASIYKCLAWCHWDSPSLLITAPRYFQATISAFGDVATYTLAKKIYGNHLAPFILFVTLSSWFNFLMAPRTLSNTMETIFTVIAMKSWPFPGTETETTIHWLRKSLFWASLACITRPTNALIWGFLGLQLLYHTPSSNHQRWMVLANAVLILSILLMLNVIVDTYFYTGYLPQFRSFRYQDLVFVPWTFIKTNVFQSIAIFYGAHPFHWYVTQGLPLMLLSFLPLTVIGMVTATPATSTTATAIVSSSLKQLVLWVVFVYSLLSHKEFRFIYPIFPLLMIFTAHGLLITWQKLGAHVKRRWCLVIMLWLTQLVLALYVSLWHQRGVMDVMIWLRQQPPMSVGFLMPCHSTPWHSVMHQIDRKDDDMMWFLTCEPPLQTTLSENSNNYLDQAALFYRDPVTFLSNFSPHPWPNMLVMFEHLLAQPGITHLLLQEKGYVECQRFFNSHVHWDKRRKGDVVVLCASL